MALLVYVYMNVDNEICSQELETFDGVCNMIWTGDIDSDWHNPLNWCPPIEVPGPSDDVCIPFVPSDNYPVIVPGKPDVSISTLNVDVQAELEVQQGAVIEIGTN